MIRTKRLLLLAVSVAWGGCVRYTPVELSALPPSQEVRVGVTDEGAVRLARHIGRLTNEVNATVAPAEADSVAVTIWLGKDYQGTSFSDVRETIVFPRSHVTSLRLRELSPWRTAAMSAAALVGTLILADQILQLGDPNRREDDGTDPPPPLIKVRIPIPWIR
ncbi:MAG TPA: hypothetical protein VMM79_09670 [Longimicrobiales bacterium]|nr:hypothetical protein [Longimicrobiales bacterium]